MLAEVPEACQSLGNEYTQLTIGLTVQVLCKEPSAFWPHQPRCAFADEYARKHMPEM